MSTISHTGRPGRPPAPTGRRNRRAGETGATIVEAALVIPIFLLFIMAMADLGLGIFQTSQATSAAADGARVGIIWDEDATDIDVVGSPRNDRIAEAVAGRLIGREHTFTAECVEMDGDVIACASANPDTDRVRVTVQWSFEPFSPVGHAAFGGRSIRAEAAMSIIRQPDGMLAAPAPTPTTTTTTTTPATTTTTTPLPASPPIDPAATTTTPPSTTTTPPTTTTLPPTCQAVTATFSPTSIQVNGARKTVGAVSVRIRTTGPCSKLVARINGAAVTMSGGPEYVGTLPKGTMLKDGSNVVVITSNGTPIYNGTTEADKR